MPIGPTSGFLDFTNATPRANVIVALSNVGVGTDVPLHALDIRGTANVADMIVNNDLTLTGGLTTNTLTINSMSMSTTSNFQQVTNVGNVTTNTVEFTNPTTGFVVTSNAEVGGELSVSGNAVVSQELSVSGNVEVGTANLFVDTTTGNVGVGVSQPTSRFEVAGADGLQEYPPKVMTDYDTYMDGYGVFRVSASSYLSTDTVQKLYDRNTGNYYHTQYPYYSTSTGEYTPGSAAQGSGYPASGTTLPSNELISGYAGEYTTLSLPCGVKLNRIELNPRGGSAGGVLLCISQAPKSIAIAGSNNDSYWELIQYFGDIGVFNTDVSIPKVIDITTTKYYKHFAMIVTKVGNPGASSNTTAFALSQLRFFGTPAPSALEDGHLTLGKALTLPRVSGHAAGVETPRAESLVVHYDTTVDSVVLGSTVVDTSGNGNHAKLYNGAAYSSTDRALTFDGVNDYLAGTQNLGTGTPAHTISGWFKRTASLSNYTWVFTIGTSTTGQMSGLLIDPTGDIVFDIFNHRIETTHTVTNNQWYHFVGVFNGGTSTWSVDTCDIYINGVLETTQTTGTNPQNFNLTGNQIYFGTSTNFLRYFTGKISNFKLWDVALTAEEVAMEYALGRTGKSINLTDTSLCLGGTAPKAQLDVRGSALFAGNVGLGTVSPESGMHYKQASDQSYLSATLGSYQNGAIFERYGTTDRWTFAQDNLGSMTFFYNTARKGYLLSTGSDSRVNFTGQHRTFIKDIPFTQAEELEGLIVSADNNKYIKMSGGIEAGSNAITTNESLPVVSLSTEVKDKKCFGVISASEDPETRQEVHGNFVSDQEKELGDTRVYINSVGEGAIWVVNTNGSLESGDYITTSNVAGYGQKQDSESLKNYTVAKITMDCDFDPVTQPLQVIKKDEHGVNVLDEHGQLQWEDHPTETEKAYKIRYLDATGVQTDEANAVHTAAFVGVTYHCG
jgi:hypothetical protein